MTLPNANSCTALSTSFAGRSGALAAQQARKRTHIALGVFCACAVHDYDSEIAQARHEDSGQVPASRACRQPIEEPDPALAGARAVLMIAAHHNPGRCGQQGRCRVKEVCVPGVKSVTPWTTGATAALRRTRQFAIM